jgi:sugar-phosphatase
VLFDMDGTLVDSTASVERAWLGWAGEFGVPLTSLSGWHGMPAAAVVQALLPAELWAEAIARVEDLEVGDVEGIQVLPGADAALLVVADSGRAAIVTSCTRRLAAARISASGLRAPALIVTADQVSRGKPDPEPFLLAAERLGVSPADCLVVEDAPAGLASARAAGATTLAVTTTNPAERLDAHAVVADLSAVRLLLGVDGVRVLGG